MSKICMIWNKQNPYLAKITSKKLLSGRDSNKEVIHYEISLDDSGIIYEPGDSLGIYPINDETLVKAILIRLQISPSYIPEGYDLNIYELLEKNFEILTPTNRLIKFINENINHKELNEVLNSDIRKRFVDFKYGKDVLDFMNLDKNLKFDLTHFLTLLKPLQHRAYSIASSNSAYPNTIHLAVSTQRWTRQKRDYGGVCSTFLSDRCKLDTKVKIFLIPNKLFKLPDDHKKPIIMIGPGTGVAPFLSFIQERKHLKSDGKNWLFFGAQTKKNDFIYEDQILNFYKNKILNNLDTAFSRDQYKKVYVQDKIYERSFEFCQWLENGAIIYVCGDAQKMALDVELTIKKIIEKELNCSDQQSLEYLKLLKKEKRYLLDVY